MKFFRGVTIHGGYYGPQYTVYMIKKALKIEIAGYNVETIEETVKLVQAKLVQLKLTFSGPIPFLSDRLVVTVPTFSKDAQEKYICITHWQKIFVTIPVVIFP